MRNKLKNWFICWTKDQGIISFLLAKFWYTTTYLIIFNGFVVPKLCHPTLKNHQIWQKFSTESNYDIGVISNKERASLEILGNKRIFCRITIFFSTEFWSDFCYLKNMKVFFKELKLTFALLCNNVIQ